MDKDRRIAFLALKNIETEKQWSNLAVGQALKEGAVSEGFVRELVFGVLRNRRLIDHNIDRFLKKPGLKINEKLLLRMGFYQLCFMDSVTDYAAVNETVAMAKSLAKGRDGFINAVMRNFLRDGKRLLYPKADPKDIKAFTQSLGIRYSASDWIVKLWLDAYGAEKTEEMLRTSLEPAPLVIRTNLMKTSRDELVKSLKDQGFEAEPLESSDTAVKCAGARLLAGELYRQGYFSVQGEASQIDVKVLDPKPGEVMMDLCAAPGGKTCAAAEAMNGMGRIIAADVYENRTALIRAQAERLGLENMIETAVCDSSVFEPSYKETADAVLCDVPCSGLGVIRQKPEIKLAERPEDLDLLPAKQYAILENGAKYLKKNGRLVYSTCTVNPAENGGIIEKFLAAHPDFCACKEDQYYISAQGPDGFYICLLRRQNA